MRGVRRRPSVHQYKKQPSLREKKAKRPRLSVCPKEAHPVGLRCPRRSLGPRPAPPSKDVTPSWTSQTWSSWSPDTQKHKFAIFFPPIVLPTHALEQSPLEKNGAARDIPPVTVRTFQTVSRRFQIIRCNFSARSRPVFNLTTAPYISRALYNCDFALV